MDENNATGERWGRIVEEGPDKRPIQELALDTEFAFPNNKNGTVYIFGRSPGSDDPKFKQYQNESLVILTPNDRKMSRKACGLMLWPDGGITIVNPTNRNLGFGLNERDTRRSVKPYKSLYLPKGTDLRNLRIDVGNYEIHAKKVSGNSDHLESVSFTKKVTKPR